MNVIYKVVLSSTLLLMVAIPSYAQEAYKIGVVNAIRVLEKSPQADTARKIIEKEFAQRNKSLVAEQNKLKTLEDRLSKDGAIMSEQERVKLEREIISGKRDFKRNQDEFREDLNFRRNEEFAKIQKKIIGAIQSIAKDHRYDIIIGEGVIYASEKTDISHLVIDYLKKGK